MTDLVDCLKLPDLVSLKTRSTLEKFVGRLLSASLRVRLIKNLVLHAKLLLLPKQKHLFGLF